MKLYVPNPENWVDFFERVSTGQTQVSQTGRGRRPHVITVNQSNPRPIKAVLPAEQTAAQAKSELKRKGINPDVVAKAFQSSTDQGRKRKRTETTSGKKGNTTPKAKRDKKGYNDIFKIE